MSQNQDIPPQSAPLDFTGQIAAQQAVQQALQQSGMDVPRMWASTIALADDPVNRFTALIFRDGVRTQFQVSGPDGAQVTQEQDVFRTVASIMLPRETVVKFLEGALAHLKSQDDVANG